MIKEKCCFVIIYNKTDNLNFHRKYYLNDRCGPDADIKKHPRSEGGNLGALPMKSIARNLWKLARHH